MAFDIDELLRLLVEREGSDLHLKVGAPPMTRIDGTLRPIEGAEKLGPEDTEVALRHLINDDRSREEFAAEGEADFAYSLKGVSRFRVNAFRQRGAVSVACRAIPFQVRTIDELMLPPVIHKLADEQRGIILLTGTTGSGKSTTLAAMIDHINSKYPHHIITLEDPIEYLHRDKRSIINQREVGSDTRSFSRAMKRILRQDPDVILVGEMRDEETVRTALSAAETGHLVLSTLHTLDATETINRIIDFFPPHLQQQARVMLASTLKGAVSQRLVPTADGVGRIAASEVLVVTGRIQDLILNPEETGKISQVIAEGEYYGMQTFDQSLLTHVIEGRVDEKVAMEFASSPHDFKLMLASFGKRASDLSQVFDEEEGSGSGEDGADVPGAEPVPAPTPPAAAAPRDVVRPDQHEEGGEPAPEPEQAPEPAPEPVADVAEHATDPEPVHVEYGSPEHAFGRSSAPRRPAPEPAPATSPAEPVAASEPTAAPEAEAGEPDVEAAGAPGLGGDDFASIWEHGGEEQPAARPAPDSASAEPPAPPRRKSHKDRLAEFRPRRDPS
jgi:twitching motility protein PilT